jgi:hypothetical protein
MDLATTVHHQLLSEQQVLVDPILIDLLGLMREKSFGHLLGIGYDRV